MQKEKEKKEIIGWDAVFCSYKKADTLKDSLIPFVFSLVTILIVLMFSLNTYNVLAKITDVSLNVLPAIISLLLAAYAIILTLFWSEYGKRIRKYDSGKKLLVNLNSSFAAIILFMIIGLLISLLFQVIISMEIELQPFFVVNLINVVGIFIVVFVLAFSIYSLKDITINIFNLGQVTPFFDEDESDEANRQETHKKEC